MPKCRICGDEFKNSVYTGFEICGNSDCWSKAWYEAIKPFKSDIAMPKILPKRHRKTIPQKDKEKVLELFKQGKKRIDIASICDMDYKNVCSVIRSAGIK